MCIGWIRSIRTATISGNHGYCDRYRVLRPSTPAEGSEATLQALKHLHPAPTEPLPEWLKDFSLKQFTVDEQVLRASLHYVLEVNWSIR